MHPSARVVIFLGPPGSGKGTQGALLSSALGVPAISTGDMLRSECDSGSQLGRAVREVLASGQLVSDDLVNQVVNKRLRQSDCKRGCILGRLPAHSFPGPIPGSSAGEARYARPASLRFRDNARSHLVTPQPPLAVSSVPPHLQFEWQWERATSQFATVTVRS